ncbi:MAG: patatin-like phospholipase family protein [Candidatus Protistobacter heckmanni]|nr:patatin-like phospholipase family protein [Candidatus Protistobacter heckmanni]
MQRRTLLKTALYGASAAALAGLAACTTTPQRPAASAPGASAAANGSTPPARPRIGLALGGGAARGFAHIGVIKALDAAGIKADLVTGTSAGSLIAALYASGLSGVEINQLGLQMDEATLADWVSPFAGRFGGLIRGEALQRYVNRLLGNRSIEQMPRPLGIAATDLQTGQGVLFRYGNIGLAVQASSSVPGVFQPVNIGGKDYVDGGLVSPVPVRYARQMGADFVIAVNISAEPSAQDASGLLGALLQTTAIMGQSINQFELERADVVLRPALPTMRGTDFQARNVAVLAGEQAVLAKLPEIRVKLGMPAAQQAAQ